MSFWLKSPFSDPLCHQNFVVIVIVIVVIIDVPSPLIENYVFFVNFRKFDFRHEMTVVSSVFDDTLPK